MASSDDKPRPDANKGECKLLGPFALFIQGALGALALLSLVYKRWRERPQRPIKIWAFDASKQVVGSILLHMANLLMSMLSSGQLSVTISTDRYQANPCSFYLLNLAIDVSFNSLSLGFSSCPADNISCTDHNRDTDIDHASPFIDHCVLHDPLGRPSRVDTVRKLRPSSKSGLVAETIIHILSWSARDETLRFLHLSDLSMDRSSW